MKGSDIWWQSSEGLETHFQVWRTLIPVNQRNLKQPNKLLSMPLMDVFISDVKEKRRETHPVIYCTPCLCACVP